jgi:multicomponent Na+:H+ antiporter subunit G
MVDLFSALLVTLGLLAFLAGTVGLLRFPDTHSRLHALTKADNLGLGLIVLGLVLRVDSAGTALKLLLIWALAILAAGAAAQLVARSALAPEQEEE